MTIICLFAELSNSVSLSNAPMAAEGSLSSEVVEDSWIVEVLSGIWCIHSCRRRRVRPAVMHNCHCALPVIRENSHTHDLHFCVRNCLSWVYELNGFLFHEILPVSLLRSSLFSSGFSQYPTLGSNASSNCVVFTLFLASSWEKHILMHLLNEFRLKVYMKSQMKNTSHFTN